MSSRIYVELDEGHAFVCCDYVLAEEYFALACREFPESVVWLVRVRPGRAGDGFDGYDVGHPDGGFSVVESELIVQERVSVDLNECALFSSYEAVVRYLGEGRCDGSLEDIEGVPIVSIEVLRVSDHRVALRRTS